MSRARFSSIPLDRLVLLIALDGVKTHVLTNAQHERSGLLADNVADPGALKRGPKELPLKPGEWNTVVLTIKGSLATVALNGVDVFEQTLDSGNSREFGLFHFADETEVRCAKRVAQRTLVGSRRGPPALAEAE